jgi:hypothetical protein
MAQERSTASLHLTAIVKTQQSCGGNSRWGERVRGSKNEGWKLKDCRGVGPTVSDSEVSQLPPFALNWRYAPRAVGYFRWFPVREPREVEQEWDARQEHSPNGTDEKHP